MRRNQAAACSRIAAILLVSVGCAAGMAVAADAPEPMNRVSFQVERSREVANDRIQALIGVTDEDTDAARLANRINQVMGRALATAKSVSSVTVRSGSYSTHPVHQDGKLRRWRASQAMFLESSDVAAVTKLVGTLQSELQLRSIQFSVSPEKRRRIEDSLIAEALEAFRGRAEVVRGNLGARGYQIAQISINTGGGAPPVRSMMMETRAMASAPAPPALEGGNSTLTVHVSGTIELE